VQKETVAFTVSCYVYQVRKNKKRLDFIIDVLKNQKELSPEEVEDLKEKRDEFTIPKKKLRIHFESPLGHGASSTIYNGFLYGQSPLTVSTKRLDTQRFQDCKVAVKVPSSIGQDEIEQLFREIDSMKRIGYHEHVVSMLGICFLAEKAVVVFELAEKDLLAYVRSFRTLKVNFLPFNIFFSILWQIASGNFSLFFLVS
jgi:serine/threonine protein kinase